MQPDPRLALHCPRCQADHPRREFRDVRTVYVAGLKDTLWEHKRCQVWFVLPRAAVAA